MSLVHHVLDKPDFDVQLKEAGIKLVVVDFYAEWCGPCKLIAPEFEKLSRTLTDVIFMKVDVDEIEEVAAQFEISSMPTIIAFSEGKQVGSMLGSNADNLKKLITHHKK